jgi:hypothetical protein
METHDFGDSWKTVDGKSLSTPLSEANSPRNHTYVRWSLHAHPDFYVFWADGHGRKPSQSNFYFANSKGDVFQLPIKIHKESEKPTRVFK